MHPKLREWLEEVYVAVVEWGAKIEYDSNKRSAILHLARHMPQLPTQIKAAAKRQSIELPEGWKASVAIHLVSAWAEHKTVLPDEVLDRAATVLAAIRQRFNTVPAARGG